MEKRLKRQSGLTALFWRYLLTTGTVFLLLAILWWVGLTILMRCGFVYPANTAANGVDEVIQALESGEIAPSEIPYYYRWALFDDHDQVLDVGNMDERHLSYAKSDVVGESVLLGIFYSQYHRIASLPDDRICVVQYDYSIPYGSKALQQRLPDFQICACFILVVSCLIAGIFSTRYFAGMLRRDAALLTVATKMIAEQRLDTPLTGQARVREFGQTLAAMDQLRVSLAQSLESQWAMEQQRRMEMAAMTHDLKTPLTIISGNAELLQEDNLNPEQRDMVDAILRSSIRLQNYVAQLRSMTSPEMVFEQEKETVAFEHLVEGWKGVGQSLCVAKQITFQCSPVPIRELVVYRTSLDRAVSNLLDNAVRYTPSGGMISLAVSEEKNLITISVEDTGPGFSATALTKGEQAFFTSDASRPQEGHVGLGLFFAGQVARKHGGRLRISNTEHGAKVELTLLLS